MVCGVWCRYVMQEDLLYPTQTPREALHLSAALRLPKTTTVAERTLIVENIIQALGLAKCADTLIGNNIIPGISGGEKKRTAIGIELVSSPDILFLDEPTRYAVVLWPPHSGTCVMEPTPHVGAPCVCVTQWPGLLRCFQGGADSARPCEIGAHCGHNHPPAVHGGLRPLC